LAKRPSPAAARPPRLRRWLSRLAGLIIAGLIAFAVVAWIAARWTPDRAHYPTQGVRIDADNGIIGWGGLTASGVDFAYIEATDGAKAHSPDFATNLAGARADDVRVGAVHRFSLCAMANDQAANFIRVVPRFAGALPAAVRLDFDEDCPIRPTRALVLSELSTFLSQIEAHSGKKAIIMPTVAFENEYGVTGAIDRTIALKRNFFPPDYAAHPWVMWEANDFVRLPGAAGTVHWIVVAPSDPAMQKASSKEPN
jgi:lysozyme